MSCHLCQSLWHGDDFKHEDLSHQGLWRDTRVWKPQWFGCSIRGGKTTKMSRMFQIYLRCLRMHQERHCFRLVGIETVWYEISFRIGMNICFRNCTATSAWSISLIFKKKPNTVCPLSQHVLYCFVSQCFRLSLSRKATSSTGVFTRKPPPEPCAMCQVRFVDHATKLLKSGASRHSVYCTIRLLVHHKTLAPPAPCVNPQSWYRLQALLNAPG